jgi:hypothetical protein
MSAGRLRCKRCGSVDHARSGLARGHQRYRCRACGCRFTNTPRRGKPPAMRALAILLYGMGGMSFSMIGRVLGVSDVAMLKWVRAEAAALPEPVVPPSVVTVEVDEMWHFLKKSLPSSGSGGPMTWISGAPWPGCWVGVVMRPAAG